MFPALRDDSNAFRNPLCESLGDLLPLDFLPKKWGHMNSRPNPSSECATPCAYLLIIK